MNGNVGLNIKPFNKVTTAATGSLDYAVGKITFYVTGFTFDTEPEYQFQQMIDQLHND